MSGVAALLQERDGQLMQGRDMPSDLMRGLLANTATDAGLPGPDFQYGFGLMNTEAAANAIERKLYLRDSLEAGATPKTYTISIPKGCKALKVMLVWNDPATARQTPYAEPVLVNNLDLQLSLAGQDYLPWVCDHRPGHVEENAVRRLDTLNNIEQITLNASELGSASEATLTVKATAIAKGTQPYTLTWWYEDDEPRVLSPAYGQLVEPGGFGYPMV